MDNYCTIILPITIAAWRLSPGARWAYIMVVCMASWPKSSWITFKLMPFCTSHEAYVSRKLWKVKFFKLT
jgi:hypothetical protein